jgi:HEAT repeat protein
MDILSRLISLTSRSRVQQPGPGKWRFDPVSFALGFVIALLVVVILYHYRAIFARLRDRARASAQRLHHRLTASRAARYGEKVIEQAQGMHLLGNTVPLEHIFVPVQMVPAWEVGQDEDEPPALTPLQALLGNNRLVLLGKSGGGRTTLLAHLLLHQADRLREAGEAERIPLYLQLPTLALSLASQPEPSAKNGAISQHLAQLTLTSMPRLTVPGVARWVQRQIEEGNALILLDGWDELRPVDQATTTRWLAEMVEAYPGNKVLVTAGTRGYAPLLGAGFVPLQLAPWSLRQWKVLAQKWEQAWPKEGNGPASELSLEVNSLTPPTRLEATVEILLRLRGEVPGQTPAVRMTRFMNLLLPAPAVDAQGRAIWPIESGHRALGRLAMAVVQRGLPILEREQIQSTVAESIPSPDLGQEGDENGAPQQHAERTQEEERRQLQIVDCCRDLTAPSGPIRSPDKQHYYFAHPILVAYWAARHLAAGQQLADLDLKDGAWSDVLRFYVGLATPEPVAKRLLELPDDIFLSRLLQAGDLLAATPAQPARWRTEVTKRLAQVWMTPRLPGMIRERLLRVLARSSEPGIDFLFKRTTNGSDPVQRAAALVGLGALGQEQHLPALEAGLKDDWQEVRLAAVQGLEILAQSGNQNAIELIVTALIEGDAHVQRAAATALADLGAEGHAVLRDAVNDPDLVLRRAAVYGLAALGEPWALETLARMQRDDDEWLVRNAAAEALERAKQHADTSAPPVEMALPKPETEAWLVAWAAERGEGTGVGDAALNTCMRALAEGDAPVRELAVETLGRLADPRSIEVLRHSLRDPEPPVREAALAALDEISQRHDIRIAANQIG